MHDKAHGAARLLASIGRLRRCCSETLCLNTSRVFESSIEKQALLAALLACSKLSATCTCAFASCDGDRCVLYIAMNCDVPLRWG